MSRVDLSARDGRLLLGDVLDATQREPPEEPVSVVVTQVQLDDVYGQLADQRRYAGEHPESHDSSRWRHITFLVDE